MTTGIQARFRTLRIVKPLHPLAFRKPVPRACSNLAQLPIGFRTIHPPRKGGTAIAACWLLRARTARARAPRRFSK
ncbi:Uncharacterised protein [Mycobacteroides abscessus subsp. abscessus]|nr:Uncharacterised protein [Mycobacteroides abscessus subsp. abscessus]SIA70114.1 Uncharacterised protein [Mycobacteroides abscessus subsp. abscessus]SII36887.1 Uncharacterised protein [Mycobacteroides abscessus subsp. abscessus]